jgi:hypothetical protein
MEPERLIFNTYYESLYNILLDRRDSIIGTIKKILPAELSKFGNFTSEDFDAYFEAALAFLEERIEMYNPLGLQYTFGRPVSDFARTLELQLSWFDSSQEFETLKKAVREIVQLGFDEQKLNDYADYLISKFGAFPDKSIVEAYNHQSAESRIPDFILALAIEQAIHNIDS